MKKLLLLFILFSATNIFAHNGKWTQMHPETSPPPRADYGMAYIGDDKVMIFGGYSYYPDTPTETVNDTWIYDLSENTWTEIHTDIKPQKRKLFQMSKLEDGKVLVFGGDYESHFYADDTWIFDFETLSWNEVSCSYHPGIRDRGVMAYIGDGKALLYSGWPGPVDYYNDAWIFDCQSMTWDSVNSTSPPPTNCGIGRERAQMCRYNDSSVLMYGGYDGCKSQKDNWFFDREFNKWIGDLPQPNNYRRDSGDMGYLTSGKILLFGGCSIVDSLYPSVTAYSNDTWIFDISDTSWNELFLDEHPSGRSFHEMANIGEGKVLLFSGIVDGNLEEYPTTWLFEYEPNDVEENENSKTAGIIQIADRVSISIPSDNSIHTPELKIVDICGRDIFVDYSSANSAVSTRIEFSTLGLAAGVYFATVKAGAEIYWFKFFAE